jgi:hypothetical protein
MNPDLDQPSPGSVEPLLSSVRAFATRHPTMLIDGNWVASVSGETLDVEDPADGRVFTKVPAGATVRETSMPWPVS